jgi:hypothetical protein
MAIIIQFFFSLSGLLPRYANDLVLPPLFRENPQKEEKLRADCSSPKVHGTATSMIGQRRGAS